MMRLGALLFCLLTVLLQSVALCQVKAEAPPPVLVVPAPALPESCIITAHVSPETVARCVRGGQIEVLAPDVVRRSVAGLRVMPVPVPRQVSLPVLPSVAPSAPLGLPARKTWGDRLNEVFGERLRQLP